MDRMNVLSDSSENASRVEEISDKYKDLTDEEHRQKISKPPGLSTFGNIGNTCYMASALQCLVKTPEFASYFKDGDFMPDIEESTKNKLLEHKRKKYNIKPDEIVELKKEKIDKIVSRTLTRQFRNLIVIAWGMNCIVLPKRFKMALGSRVERFSNSEQQDSAELIIALLDTIHEETKTNAIIKASHVPENIIQFETELSKVEELYEEKKNSLTNSESELSTDELPIVKKLVQALEDKIYRMKQEHVLESVFVSYLRHLNSYVAKNHSVVVDIFHGLYMTEITCDVCKCVTHNFVSESLLHVPLPSHRNGEKLTISKCLDEAFEREQDTSNVSEYDCQNCKTKTSAHRKGYIWHPPHVLIIHLKRFLNHGNSISKINTNIDFPLTNLDMTSYISPYVTKVNQTVNRKKRSGIYDLYGVIYHSGGTNGGHYTASVKNFITDDWYHYNDENSRHIPASEVQEKVVKQESYVLFYIGKD